MNKLSVLIIGCGRIRERQLRCFLQTGWILRRGADTYRVPTTDDWKEAVGRGHHDAGVSNGDAHYVAQANAILDQLKEGRACLCTFEAAAQTLRFNLAALASARIGQRVRCRDIK